MPTIDVSDVIAKFNDYCDSVNETLNAVRTCLGEGKYTAAADLMNTLTQRQAQTSLSIRSALIKGGYMKGDER